MPNWLRVLPLWMRMLLVIVTVLVAASPGFLGPGLAASSGWERSTGSVLGALMSSVLFLVLGGVSWWINRREARRRAVQELDRLLASCEDADGGARDLGDDTGSGQTEHVDPGDDEARASTVEAGRGHRLNALALVALPVMPMWTRDAFPEIFPEDHGTADAVCALLAVSLFGVAAMVMWFRVRE